jgi:hypothetical protein
MFIRLEQKNRLTGYENAFIKLKLAISRTIRVDVLENRYDNDLIEH